jgi:hypothetical protein
LLLLVLFIPFALLALPLHIVGRFDRLPIKSFDLLSLWLEVAKKKLPARLRRAPGQRWSFWTSAGLVLFDLFLLVALIPFVLLTLPVHIVVRLDLLAIKKFDLVRSLYEWANAGLTFLYLLIAAILLPLGLLLLSPLRMVSRFPGVTALIRAIERGLNAFLAGSIGDIQVYSENPIDARQIRAPLERSLAYLNQEGCAEIYLLAHSAGTPICFEVLAGDPAITSRVKRFFSYGSIVGIIGKSPSKVRPALLDSLRSVPGTFRWDNFCSKYDVAGPDVIPDDVAPDVIVSVRNEDSVRTDHVTYEYNLRQFVGPIVECIWQGGGELPTAQQQQKPQESRAMRLGMRRIVYALVLPIVFAFVFWSAFTWWTKVLVVDPTWITWLTGDLGVESWAQKHLTDYDAYGQVTTYDEDGKIRTTLVDLTEYRDCGEDAGLRPVPQNADGQHVVVLNPCTPVDDASLGVNELWEKLLTGAFALLLMIPVGFLIFSVYRNNIWWPKEMDLRRRVEPARVPEVQTGARVMSADGKQVGVVKEVRQDRFLVDVRRAPDYCLGMETLENASKDIVQLCVTKQAIGPAKLRPDAIGPRYLEIAFFAAVEIAFFAAVSLIFVASVWEVISFFVVDSDSVFDNLEDTLGSAIVWAVILTTFLIVYDFILEKDRDDPSPYVRS